MRRGFRHIVSMLLALCLLAGVVPVTALATTEGAAVASGDCGKNGSNVTWTFYDTGELLISGTGDMGDFRTHTTIPWYPYCSKIKTVTILDGVTSIGGNAFIYCDALTSITIPSGVVSIGTEAFWGCSVLSDITIPTSVTSIGDRAFVSCYSLAELTIPIGVTKIGREAFHACTALTEVTIPDSVTSIGRGAFANCHSLTNVIIPDSVTRIEDATFQGCNALTDIIIPNGVTYIADNAFAECENLRSVTLPEGVTHIGNSTFFDCKRLYNVTIPNSVTHIGSGAFTYCLSLTNIILPDNITSISDKAFSYCSALIDITIPDKVTYIGNSAFSNCSALIDITIPDKVIRIGGSAFCECKSLRSVTIPRSVAYIGELAFSCGPALKSVYYSGSQEQWAKISIDSGNYGLLTATICYDYSPDPWEYLSFSNNGFDFFQPGEPADYSAGSYFDHFSDVLAKYYSPTSISGYQRELARHQEEEWGGSCTGFAIWEGMVNQGLMPARAMDGNAKDLPSVDKPRDNIQVRELLNYYQLSQFIPDLWNTEYGMGWFGQAGKKQLEEITSAVISGTPHMFSYYYSPGLFKRLSGHSIILEGGTMLPGGSYRLIGQDNRLHGFTIVEEQNGERVDTGRPATVEVNISSDFSSCTVSFIGNVCSVDENGNARFMSLDINEKVKKFASCSSFEKFAEADPTGAAASARLFSTVENSPSTLYFEPAGDSALSFSLNYQNNDILINDDTLDENPYIQNYWYTTGGATLELVTAEDGTSRLESRDTPSTLIMTLDSNPNETYTISNLSSGRYSYVGDDGYAAVSVTDASSAILDLGKHSVTLADSSGDFSVTVTDDNNRAITVEGSNTSASNIVASAADGGITLDAPAGDYTVTFDDSTGSKTTTSVTSTGDGSIYLDGSPAVCSPYQSVYDAKVDCNGQELTLTLIPLQSTPVPETITVWLAAYRKDGKMIDVKQLPRSSPKPDGSTSFSGTVSSDGISKLFVLDGAFTPITEKYSRS